VPFRAALARRNRTPRDVLAAAACAGIVSGAPSTLDALIRGRDPLASSRAAGALLVGERRAGGALLLDDRRATTVQLAAAIPVHAALSLGWAAVLAAVLPPRREPLWGALAGLPIAALDLGLIGRRLPPIAALPQPPQWADHIAFGLVVGAVLARRRQPRPTPDH